MEIEVTINNIVGLAPYDVYICDVNLDVCLYVETVDEIPFKFEILRPFNNQRCYKVKVIDSNGCIIIRDFCIELPKPTPTPTSFPVTTTTTFIPTTTTTTFIPTTTTTTFIPTTTTTTFIPTTTTTTFIPTTTTTTFIPI